MRLDTLPLPSRPVQYSRSIAPVAPCAVVPSATHTRADTRPRRRLAGCLARLASHAPEIRSRPLRRERQHSAAAPGMLSSCGRPSPKPRSVWDAASGAPTDRNSRQISQATDLGVLPPANRSPKLLRLCLLHVTPHYSSESSRPPIELPVPARAAGARRPHNGAPDTACACLPSAPCIGGERASACQPGRTGKAGMASHICAVSPLYQYIPNGRAEPRQASSPRRGPYPLSARTSGTLSLLLGERAARDRSVRSIKKTRCA